MFRHRKKSENHIVAMELCHSELDLVIIDPATDGNQERVHTKTITWREESPLHSDAGIKDLTRAFKSLVVSEKLGSAKIYLALNGDFCVTRVVSGSADHVRREVRHLEDRSALYLSLGAGEKILAANVRQIDVRHQHAWVAVTNRRTLEAVLAAADGAGLNIELLEPSLVALCRAVGTMGDDSEAPVIIVELDERGVEMGISYQGRLLLDYRPGGLDAKEEIASILLRHLERLNRYCTRHFRYVNGDIQSVYLCGEQNAVESVHKQLSKQDQLQVHVFDPRTIQPQWTFEDPEHGTEMIAALGTALAAPIPPSERNGPDLMDRRHGGLRVPLVRGLIRATWPIAAAILIAVTLGLLAMNQRTECDTLEAEAENFAPAKLRVEQVRIDLASAEKKLGHLKRIKFALAPISWNTLISNIAHCMPPDIWLERVSIDGTGTVSITGASYSEDGVYELVRWLKKAPGMSQVALESTSPAQLKAGPSTRFDIKCKFAGIDDSEAEVKQDD